MIYWPVGSDARLNPSLERTRTSRSSLDESLHQWRLVPAAHTGRWAVARFQQLAACNGKG
jgi:hypothetical protein